MSPGDKNFLQSLGLRGSGHERLSEHDEQALLVQWAGTARVPGTRHMVGDFLAAVPNAGKRSARAGARLKAEGLRPGYPDLILDIAARGYHGLRIEMKRTDATASDVQENQREWLDRLNRQGYCARVARGFNEARELILWYLGS